MRGGGGLLYVLVSVWKTFFRYLLYVSVSNHGLLMSMQWWSYHAAIRGDYKKLHLLNCQKSHFGSFSFLNHSTQRRVVCYLNSSSSQKQGEPDIWWILPWILSNIECGFVQNVKVNVILIIKWSYGEKNKQTKKLRCALNGVRFFFMSTYQ